MPEIQVFHKRFGGQVSLEQELTDLTSELPIWARPIWKLVLSFLLPFIKRIKIERTMRQVDEQSEHLRSVWEAEDRHAVVNAAVAKAKELHPDAHVEAVAMPDHPVDAVYIEHPPEPGNKAQELLGFGSIEIHAPYEH
jgi:hypothetical protein